MKQGPCSVKASEYSLTRKEASLVAPAPASLFWGHGVKPGLLRSRHIMEGGSFPSWMMDWDEREDLS